jgi:cysteinyl-tRNA synthetase
LRLELVRTHYRTNSNFTLQGLRDCQRMIDRWASARTSLAARSAGTGAGPFQPALIEFKEALADDLNVARAIAALNTAIAEDASGDPIAELAALDAMNSVLGVFERNEALQSAAADDLATKVEALLERRRAARAAKDWAESDRVRDELTALGVRIKDGPQGTTWERAV